MIDSDSYVFFSVRNVHFAYNWYYFCKWYTVKTDEFISFEETDALHHLNYKYWSAFIIAESLLN